MTVKVNCENRNRKRRIDLSKIEKVVKTALKALGKRNVELNVIFVSNQKIRALHRAYLGIDTATDVISFPSGKEPVRRPGGAPSREFLGDLAISSDKAAQNAKIYGTAFIEETALYAIHGTLHLVGYDDTTKKAREAMRGKENELLQKAGKYL